MGSNGLSSARHDVFHKYLVNKYPESFDNGIPQELAYLGKYKLTDAIEGLGLDAGQLVLSPTRTYAPVVAKVLNENFEAVHGMIHCSGGAQTKIMHFVKQKHIIKDQLFDLPPLFRIIKEESGTGWSEMYKVFNMGHRFEFYVPQNQAQAIIDAANSFHIEAKVVGRVTSAATNKLTIQSEFGTFEY